MAFDDHSGANKMANILSSRIAKQAKTSLVLDFGQINKDWSLTTNTFPTNIPKSDYTICRHVSGVSVGSSTHSHGGHYYPGYSADSHSHAVALPGLNPGDRVLVAWIENEACVIDVICPA